MVALGMANGGEMRGGGKGSASWLGEGGRLGCGEGGEQGSS